MVGLSAPEILLVLLILGAILFFLFRRGRKAKYAIRDTARSCLGCGVSLAADSSDGLCPSCRLKVQSTATGEPHIEGVPTASYVKGVPEPGKLAGLFPKLEILRLLGQGGMGAVYKARQVKLDRVVAVKILPPQTSGDPAFTERFGREARALARLNHPHIVVVHDFGEAGGQFYLVMEFVDGLNLRQLLRAGPLKLAEVLRIIPQVCDALQYAHDAGVVHRDIKPENVLLDKTGRVKIADFGLAKLLSRSPGEFTLTGTHQAMGTPHYMAPEQIEKPLAVDHRADIYALGVLLYEMLTGELPLGRFAPPSQKAALDSRVDDVVLKALEKDPALRYQKVSEFWADLQRSAVPCPEVAK